MDRYLKPSCLVWSPLLIRVEVQEEDPRIATRIVGVGKVAMEVVWHPSSRVGVGVQKRWGPLTWSHPLLE